LCYCPFKGKLFRKIEEYHTGAGKQQMRPLHSDLNFKNSQDSVPTGFQGSSVTSCAYGSILILIIFKTQVYSPTTVSLQIPPYTPEFALFFWGGAQDGNRDLMPADHSQC
jgi:hypothetical protein